MFQLLPNDIIIIITMKPKTAPVLVALLTLTIVQFQIVASGSGIALPRCNDTCGDVQIPYPFGIGPGCFLLGFELSCKRSSNGSFVPFLLNDIPVLEFSSHWRLWGQVKVNKSVTSSCSSPQQTSSNTYTSWNLSGTPYRFSRDNWFTVIGCDIIADISYGNSTNIVKSACVTTGCYSQNSTINGFCRTGIPSFIESYQVTLQPRNYNSSKQQNSSQCGYAALADFSQTSDNLYKQHQMPVRLDWSIGDESCDTAQANKSFYACVSDNSQCIDSYFDESIRPGYLCRCSSGYDGNPYLEGGCVGISLSLKFTLPVHFDYYIGAYLEIQRTYK